MIPRPTHHSRAVSRACTAAQRKPVASMSSDKHESLLTDADRTEISSATSYVAFADGGDHSLPLSPASGEHDDDDDDDGAEVHAAPRASLDYESVRCTNLLMCAYAF